MQRLSISSYNRSEQKAYWINLYNALTVESDSVALSGGVDPRYQYLSRAYWRADLGAQSCSRVEGEKLSLDDIEHRILRPIWKDERIHYALNCASLGCPNLQPAAYTGENTEALLDKGAKEFINHPRGVALTGGKLKVSSIYVWFQEDFGGDAEGLMEHWRNYANPATGGGVGKIPGRLESRLRLALERRRPKAVSRTRGPMNISVIVPVLNEEKSIAATLQALAPLATLRNHRCRRRQPGSNGRDRRRVRR